MLDVVRSVERRRTVDICGQRGQPGLQGRMGSEKTKSDFATGWPSATRRRVTSATVTRLATVARPRLLDLLPPLPSLLLLPPRTRATHSRYFCHTTKTAAPTTRFPKPLGSRPFSAQPCISRH